MFFVSEEIISKDEVNYILGNPPFVGARNMSTNQKQEVLDIFDRYKGAGNLDYVTAWYKRASEYIYNSNIRVAFVSTNSIVQGEQASILWEVLFCKYDIYINFAYRSFSWNNEAKGKAMVHCVIVGFSCDNGIKNKKIFLDNGEIIITKHINNYLINAENIFIKNRKNPICNVPTMCLGSMANDGGNFLFSDNEKEDFVDSNPESEKWFKKFVGAKEYISNITRWCLWLNEVNPTELKNSKGVLDVISRVRSFRLASKRKATQNLADTSINFGEIRQPRNKYILIPRHSSEKRKYVPIGFMDSDIICGDANLLIDDSSLYDFGILTSNMHMVWMKTFGGRLESRYRYSKDIVYNNFPWCNPTEKQKQEIEKFADEVLKARELYPDSSLADLYDPLTMPPELVKAHNNLDRAVEKAYGKVFKSDEDRVAFLMKEYKRLTSSKDDDIIDEVAVTIE